MRDVSNVDDFAILGRQAGMPTSFLLIALVMFLVFLAFVVGFALLFVAPWLRAFLHGTPVSLIHIVGMRLRGNPVSLLVDAYISLQRAQVYISLPQLENTYIDHRHRVTTSLELIDIVRQDGQLRDT